MKSFGSERPKYREIRGEIKDNDNGRFLIETDLESITIKSFRSNKTMLYAKESEGTPNGTRGSNGPKSDRQGKRGRVNQG